MGDPTAEGAERLKQFLQLTYQTGCIGLGSDRYHVYCFEHTILGVPDVWEETKVEYHFNIGHPVAQLG